MNFPDGFSKNGNMCFFVEFVRGPVICVEKIPGNRGGFCQADFQSEST